MTLTTALASVSLADPAGSSPLVAAILWLQGTLLGTVATTVAVICVAWVGFLALSGRIPVRRGMTVVAGCFILFGASSIVAGLRQAIGSGELRGAPVAMADAAPPPLPPPGPPYDPYAGASVIRPH